jgi:hypothetical protein
MDVQRISRVSPYDADQIDSGRTQQAVNQAQRWGQQRNERDLCETRAWQATHECLLGISHIGVHGVGSMRARLLYIQSLMCHNTEAASQQQFDRTCRHTDREIFIDYGPVAAMNVAAMLPS